MNSLSEDLVETRKSDISERSSAQLTKVAC